jgi:endonuclease/exonuclease/phosphatase family metal-dependent hydrolase
MHSFLTLATYNIHKGMSAFGRRFMLHELKHALNGLNPDLVFLQEVQGSGRMLTYRSQYEFLSQDLPHTTAYGLNASRHNKHHGNAIMSLHPIITWQNQDISLNRFEKRGLLHCQVQLPEVKDPLHTICVHLNLLARDRRKQIHSLIEFIQLHVPTHTPLIIAGDFNDWRNEISAVLFQQLGLHEVFELIKGKPARSFPATLPVLPLDRVYMRGFIAHEAQVLTGAPWNRLSDHAPLAVKLQFMH